MTKRVLTVEEMKEWAKSDFAKLTELVGREEWGEASHLAQNLARVMFSICMSLDPSPPPPWLVVGEKPGGA